MRETDRQTETDRQIDRQTETDRDRDGQRSGGESTIGNFRP